jgi:hypothetical protein
MGDARGVAIRVEANHMAVGFYEKFGFVNRRDPVKMPDMEYFLRGKIEGRDEGRVEQGVVELNVL